MKREMRLALTAVAVIALLAADSLITRQLILQSAKSTPAAVKVYGEAEQDAIAQFRLEREQLRARQEAELNDMIHSEATDAEAAAQARQQLLALMESAEAEQTIEGILQARGFSDPLVSVRGGAANVLIRGETLSQRESAVILELVMRETGLTGGNVKIIPVK